MSKRVVDSLLESLSIGDNARVLRDRKKQASYFDHFDRFILKERSVLGKKYDNSQSR